MAKVKVKLTKMRIWYQTVEVDIPDDTPAEQVENLASDHALQAAEDSPEKWEEYDYPAIETEILEKE